MGVESYLHKYAKVVVCSWLRKKIRIGSNFKGLNNVELSLESKKEGPMFNVYPEYPVCKCKTSTLEKVAIVGLDVMWDKWLKDNGIDDKVKSRTRIPTIYELKDMSDKLEIITVFDIGVIDESKLKYVFEIEHTHACELKKIKFIEDNGLFGYELSAQKVMEQVKLPFMLPINRSWNT